MTPELKPGWKLTCVRCGKVRAVVLGCSCNEQDYAHVLDTSDQIEARTEALARLNELQEDMYETIYGTKSGWAIPLIEEWYKEIEAIRKALGASDAEPTPAPEP